MGAHNSIDENRPSTPSAGKRANGDLGTMLQQEQDGASPKCASLVLTRLTVPDELVAHMQCKPEKSLLTLTFLAGQLACALLALLRVSGLHACLEPAAALQELAAHTHTLL